MNIQTKKLSDLKEWDKNPRTVSKEAFERLVAQIKELAPYKPLLVDEEGVVLGGNMRLKAFEQLGITDVVVSVVHAPTDDLKLKYALSDNDNVGKTDNERILEMIENYPEINLEQYAIRLDEPETLKDFMGQFNVHAGDGEKEFDENIDIEHKCPRCGYEW